MRYFGAFLAALTAPPASLATPAIAAEVASPQAALDELLAADRAFSASGAKANIADSIAAMLIGNAVMPTPGGFAIGRDAVVAAIRGNPAMAAATAEWSPVRGGISADGTQGFTYGFMTVREAGKPTRRAKYLAYWVKRPEGWRVAFYKRGASADGEVSTAMHSPALPPAFVSADPQRIHDHLAELKAAEKAFSDRAQEIGLGQAFVEFGSADAMNLGRGADFTYGNEAIGKAISANNTTPLHWSADQGALVASSGDLGVTWGYIRPNTPPPEGQPAAYSFFTVWRKAAPDQPWRYIAE